MPREFIHPLLCTPNLSLPPNWKPSRKPSTKSARNPTHHQNTAASVLEGGRKMKRQLDFGGHFAYISNNDDEHSLNVYYVPIISLGNVHILTPKRVKRTTL